ncbi:hypothetical protein STEG23_014355, partial [Scotinomys teguina]
LVPFCGLQCQQQFAFLIPKNMTVLRFVFRVFCDFSEGQESTSLQVVSDPLRSLHQTGIMLEYEKDGELKTKSIDLLDLSPSTDVNTLVEEIQKVEPLITVSRTQQVRLLVQRLQEKLKEHCDHSFYLFKVVRAHILPLTNVALNKSGSRFITGSYDRTCKVWDTASGEELHTLEGHRNVVYAIAFNNPYGDKIATGSFDKTCKLWSAESGKCYYTFRGHTAEIMCLSFNPQSTVVATGSMDTTAKLWDIENGEEVVTLTGHLAEIVSLSFNTSGDRIVTGSFDHTIVVWDASTGRKVHTLIGHCGEISSALFNWDCSLIVAGSLDKNCMLWDATSGKCIATLTGHDDEILDSCFDSTGKLIATASADGTARVYNATTRKCITKLEGHEGEISKISFNPQGNRLLTGSSDKTARIWDVQTGQCLQILEGHTDEVFSCAFNYKGNIIITAAHHYEQISSEDNKNLLMKRFDSVHAFRSFNTELLEWGQYANSWSSCSWACSEGNEGVCGTAKVIYFMTRQRALDEQDQPLLVLQQIIDGMDVRVDIGYGLAVNCLYYVEAPFMDDISKMASSVQRFCGYAVLDNPLQDKIIKALSPRV